MCEGCWPERRGEIECYITDIKVARGTESEGKEDTADNAACNAVQMLWFSVGGWEKKNPEILSILLGSDNEH